MKLPDSPQILPFLQLIQWIARPLNYLDTCARHYGDPFTAKISGFPPYVLFSNPQAIQEIFTANPNLFESGSRNELFRPMLGEYSLLLLDGNQHQRQRRLLAPSFHGEQMRAFGQVICNITEQAFSQWMIGESFSILASMQEISLRVILQALFGLNEGERFQQLRQLLSSLLDFVGSPFGCSFFSIPLLQKDLGAWSLWGRFLRQKQQVDELIYAEICDRRQQVNLSHADILTLLMSAQDETGQPMTDVELRDEIMTLLVAGHETTATALAWAFYWIHYLPEVLNKLLQELDTLALSLDPSKITQLPYLTAVCQETLRIYPPVLVAFPRILKSPLQVMSYQFNSGTVLAPCIYLTHRRQELYSKPERFMPERFLERQFSPYEYLPFGGGNRRCIGMAFAQFEMKLVIATVLSRLQLAITDKHPIRPIRRGLTVAPSGGMQMIVTDRQRNEINVKSWYSNS